MSSILTAKDLCKTFSNESLQQHVLKNLNLTIEKGDFTVIMGNSGSGKSTLLYALSGMDRPTLGSISYKGEEISKLSNDKLAVFRRTHCGFVFQQNYLNDTMSVLDNIMVCGLLVNRDRKALAKKAKELMVSVGLSEQAFSKFPTQLSGGEQQRAAVVRGIINEPEILFADEPTGALDSRTTDSLLRLFHEINEEGQTILMVTHSIKAASHANRILFIKDGEVFHQLYRGNLTNQELYGKISDTLTILTAGGERDE